MEKINLTYMIAVKLRHEGVTAENFTLEAAREVISKTVGAVPLLMILENNTENVKQSLSNIKIKE